MLILPFIYFLFYAGDDFGSARVTRCWPFAVMALLALRRRTLCASLR